MLKDFIKLETFLTVVRERSFSKASAKLGISQPAVTQQIKFIEKYLETKIIERKKNGIKLTNEGEELYKIVINIEKTINEAEQDILRIIDKKMTFKLGASFTIGNYILPGECLNTISGIINNDINLTIKVSNKLVEDIKDKKLDLALIESLVVDDDLVYREWLEDELVVFSNTPLPKMLSTEELYNYRWICRNEGSHTRQVVTEVFEELGVSCKNFDVLSEVDNTTAVLQTIKRSKKSIDLAPVVSIISKHAIADEVNKGELFEARIRGYNINRKL